MKKILTLVVFPVIIIVLAYLIVASILQPVNFEKEKKSREKVAVERLENIRTLQVAYKSKYNKFTASLDSLIDFYKYDTIIVVKQIGSMDDSLAVAQGRVIRQNIKIPVKDTLLNTYTRFDIDSLKYIPFSGGEMITMKALSKMVSGVNVPLFEAEIPFRSLLKGMDSQLIINLVSDREAIEKYPGLKVGSITAPNNNAGNWE